jgi:hypothetical protein
LDVRGSAWIFSTVTRLSPCLFTISRSLSSPPYKKFVCDSTKVRAE